MTSPSTLTLSAVKGSSIPNITGVCRTSDDFLTQVNEATQRLMEAGEWWATVAKARVCIQRNCIAWPRWVGTVLATNYCRSNRPIQNRWYDFIPLTARDCACAGRWQSNVAFVDDGLTPVFSNVPCGQAYKLRVYTRLQADVGKTVTLYGIGGNASAMAAGVMDAAGQEIMTKDALGNWTVGETLTLATPYVETSAIFREVTRVSKEVTTGPVDLYQYDSTNALLLDMGHYDPGETEPMYRHSTIRGGCGAYSFCSSDGTTSRKVEILAKLQFIPVVADTDIVQIDNIAALKLMIQALRLEEAGDDTGALNKQVLAVKELNRQLRNKLPLDQIPIEVSGCGTALPSFHGIGQIQ